MLSLLILSPAQAGPLHDAVDKGDVAQVKRLISKGADVNAEDTVGMTPLMQASRQGNTSIVSVLLDAGADVNALRFVGFNDPALIYAVRGGHDEIVRLLIQAGADLHVKGGMGHPALIWALIAWPRQATHTAIALALIDAGSDVNGGEENRTPLWYAVAAGEFDVARALIAQGADVEANIAYAKSKGINQMVRALQRAAENARLTPPPLEILISRLEALQDAEESEHPDPDEIPSYAEVKKARIELDAHVKSHPNDAKALLLWARIMRELPFGMQLEAAGEVSEPDYDTIHTALDRVLQLEPRNAEGHYWKGRLTGPPLIAPTSRPSNPQDLDQAIRHIRRAVALAPNNGLYRETLAIYLADQGHPGEGENILSNVFGETHPMIPLLSDLASIPLPEGAELLLSHIISMSAYIPLFDSGLEDHMRLRVRAYRLSMTPENIEAFYRSRWGSFRFFNLNGEAPNTEKGRHDGDRDFIQYFKWRSGRLEPATRLAELPDNPKGGIIIQLSEVDEQSEEQTVDLRPQPREPVCYLVLINYRKRETQE